LIMDRVCSMGIIRILHLSLYFQEEWCAGRTLHGGQCPPYIT
jgi:hypothetical protein